MKMTWERIKTERKENERWWDAVADLLRAKVPGGWFILIGQAAMFYPDPEHKWDGNCLP
jgi:hypothetical protein